MHVFKQLGQLGEMFCSHAWQLPFGLAREHQADFYTAFELAGEQTLQTCAQEVNVRGCLLLYMTINFSCLAQERLHLLASCMSRVMHECLAASFLSTAHT